MKYVWFLGMMLASALIHAQVISGGPNGASVSCGEIISIEGRYVDYQPSSVIFGIALSDWTPETVAFFKSAADTCGRGIKPEYIERTKIKIDELAKIPGKKRADAEAKAAVEDKKSKLDECEKTKEYALYNAEDSVIQGLETIKDDKERIAQERRISQTSGVRNLSNDYVNGAALVGDKDALNAAWSEYKKLGGKASSPQAVRRTHNDPCLNFSK